METTDEKITRLTAFWYEYVNIDHHKDRDCHFYITKHWAYGDPPTYAARHEGYIAERWYGPERKTHGEAQYDLLKFLEGEAAGVIKHAKKRLGKSYDG